MSTFNLLTELPEELLQEVLERIGKSHLGSLSLVSKWCYQVAAPLIWREVELVDCRTHHEDCFDEHDDTPIIRKLLLLANKPLLASSVQMLTHRCHLPPPAIFSELPLNPFSGQTLSSDPRTIRLVQHAVAQMTHVHTLRIILGHASLTDALLRCFFDANRYTPESGCIPIRKLWLENCRFSAGLDPEIESHPYELPLQLEYAGLESVRFRRLHIRPNTAYDWSREGVVYARGGRGREMQDGTGGYYITTINDFSEEYRVGNEHLIWLANGRVYHPPDGQPVVDLGPSPLEKLFEKAHHWDDLIYLNLPASTFLTLPDDVQQMSTMSYHDRAVLAYRGQSLDAAYEDLERQPIGFPLQRDKLLTRTKAYKEMQREQAPHSAVTGMLLANVGATLTSLTLDWILSMPMTWNSRSDDAAWIEMFWALLDLRFPHLRAFQFRNGVVADTLLPNELLLLDRGLRNSPTANEPLPPEDADLDLEPFKTAGLGFMEAHPKLQCLAWPMTHFFASGNVPADLMPRVQAVIENLGRNLVDLRVDSLYSGSGERMSESWGCQDLEARSRRRNFITLFASQMTKLESIKIEGGMPRDERREIIRALHRCPLQKIVMIGVCSTLGNTWGQEGSDIAQSLIMDDDGLEAEDKSTIFELGPTKPQTPPSDFTFTLEHGWEGSAPMLHTLASFHGSTVRELKFCGYKGAPILFSPTPITTPMLAPLKHFPNLESLIMSMYLTTLFEGSLRDTDIIAYWLNSRTSTSTALVRITDEEPEGWEKELRTKFAPDALAWRITNFVGPFLSEEAKGRKGGVHVRASFCLGENGALFDVDLWVGKGVLGSDVCLGFEGPREEFEVGRRRGKLEGRRWF